MIACRGGFKTSMVFPVVVDSDFNCMALVAVLNELLLDSLCISFNKKAFISFHLE